MLRVTLVEDSAVVRTVWRDMMGYVGGIEIVGEYGRLETAIEGIRRERPDVVVLDLQLADSSGIDVLRAVRSDLPETKVIVITNFVDAVYRRVCGELGVHAFYDKNREIGRFLREVSHLEAQSRRRPTDDAPPV